MEIISLIISLLALAISWFTYKDNAYRVQLAPYWDWSDSHGKSSEKADLTVAIINRGGRNIVIRAIGSTTAERDITVMGLPARGRKNIQLLNFESPEVIGPNSRKEWHLLLTDQELIHELDNTDAFIWTEDGMYNIFERSVINGSHNKKMRWTRKGAPMI